MRATRVVPAPPEPVYAFLSRLENHWRLADRWIEVVAIAAPAESGGGAYRGRVRMRGPLGLRRTADTCVISARPTRSLTGTAELAHGTRAEVSWALQPRGELTEVTLAARLEHAGALDRALLALGGARWLKRRFASVLDRLAGRFAAGATAVPGPVEITTGS